MTRHLNQGLKYEAWPIIDRELWHKSFNGNDIFDSGSSAHLSPATKQSHLYAYSLWLGFLKNFDPELLEQNPDQRITHDNIDDFVDTLRDNCTETTISCSLSRLFYVIRVLCPNDDWHWLYRAAGRIAAKAVRNVHPPVLSSDLYRIGLRAMNRAEGMAKKAGVLTKSAAILYRDGLLIATLVEAPMRRKPFSLISIGDHLEKQGLHWVISIPAEITKTKTAQEYQLSKRLSGCMDVFLDRIRPAFPGSKNHNLLWPQNGRPMTDKMVRRRIIKRTEEGLGFPVPPHRFRSAAATFIATVDPENILMAKDLLGHKSFATTQKHYIDAAQSRKAGGQFSEILRNLSAR